MFLYNEPEQCTGDNCGGVHKCYNTAHCEKRSGNDAVCRAKGLENYCIKRLSEDQTCGQDDGLCGAGMYCIDTKCKKRRDPGKSCGSSSCAPNCNHHCKGDEKCKNWRCTRNGKTADGIKHYNFEVGCHHNSDSKKWCASGYSCGGKCMTGRKSVKGACIGGGKVLGVRVPRVCAPGSWDYYLDEIGG